MPLRQTNCRLQKRRPVRFLFPFSCPRRKRQKEEFKRESTHCWTVSPSLLTLLFSSFLHRQNFQFHRNADLRCCPRSIQLRSLVSRSSPGCLPLLPFLHQQKFQCYRSRVLRG